ncbi:MAG: beta strand repeat-containing protein, partial [Pseudomonadales bacterium]
VDNDTILGDGGVALYNAGVLVSLSSDAAEVGDDTITVANGNNVIAGGAGVDAITTTDGVDIVLGDNGQLVWSATGIIESVTATDLTNGAGDIIKAGDGDNIIVGATGNDVIESGVDNDTILGDGGVALYNAGVLVSLSSDAAEVGDDTITVANGNNVIAGGAGVDAITTTDGVDIVLGDNGQLVWSATGIIESVTATDLTNGAGDIIKAGDGDNIIVGATGNDVIESGVDNDTILGDGGVALYNAGILINLSSTALESGNDSITVSNGNNIIVTGQGDDGITTGLGSDIIASDNVQLDFNSSAILINAASMQTANGGADTVITTGGDNIIIAGQGMDDVTSGDGVDLVAGDNVEFNFTSAGVLASANSIAPADAGNDVIVAGDGDNTVIAGSGVDNVTTGMHNDIIFGDNASLTFNAQGQLVQLLSTQLDFGDVDTIVAGDGNNIIAGGRGSDNVDTGNGIDIVAGDNIIITLDNAIPTMMTPVDDIGGNDVISLGAGGAFVIAGAGDDEVTNAAGDSVIIGDQGTINFAANGLYADAFTGDVDIAGNDILIGGSDSDVIFGGAGSDQLAGKAGEDFLVGDAGMITRDDLLVTLESISTPVVDGVIPESDGFFTGADDVLDGGLDNDYMIGGFGDDLFVGDLSDDIMTGEYTRMRLTIDADQDITGLESMVSLGQGPLDLIRVVQQELYTASPYTATPNTAANFDSLVANAALDMPVDSFTQTAAWGGLDSLVFDDQLASSSTSRSAISPQAVSASSEADLECGSDQVVVDQNCAPELDVEQICADFKADMTNASEAPEACQAPLSEDVNSQAVDEAPVIDPADDSHVDVEAGIAALAGWAALNGQRQSSEQRLDRSEYALVAAKAQSKRFMSWARFRD